MTKLIIFIFLLFQVGLPGWAQRFDATIASKGIFYEASHAEISEARPFFPNYLAELNILIPKPPDSAEVVAQATAIRPNSAVAMEWMHNMEDFIESIPKPGLFYIGVCSLLSLLILLVLPYIERYE